MSLINVSTRSKSVLTVAALSALFIILLATAALAGIHLPGQQLSDGMQTQRIRYVPVSTVRRTVSVHIAPEPVAQRAIALQPPTRLPDPAPTSPMAIGKAMAAKRGWIGGQWTALRQLWSEESGWNPRATNRSSGACGIPQRHPCNGLSSQSVEAQIAWGLDYIASRYGSPASALSAKHRKGWY